MGILKRKGLTYWLLTMLLAGSFFVLLYVWAENPSNKRMRGGQVNASDDRVFFTRSSIGGTGASETFTIDIPQNRLNFTSEFESKLEFETFNYFTGNTAVPSNFKTIFELKAGEALNIPLELPLNTRVRITSIAGSGGYRYGATGRKNYDKGPVNSGWFQ